MVKDEDILVVIHQIVSEGGKLTRETLTKRLGGGSPNKIAPVLAAFKKRRREKIPAHVQELIQAYRALSPIDQKIFRENLLTEPKRKMKRSEEK